MLRQFKKYPWITLIIIFLLGLVLRLLYFKEISFGYDQARDAFESLAILSKFDIKLIGPSSDIPGVNHGVLYWYLISPFYSLSGGDPRAVKIFSIFINLFNIFFIYHFSFKLFKNKKISLLSAFIFAVSFEAINYARWLSNPAFALITITIFFYGLWLLINNNAKGLLIMIITWAISFQLEFFLIFHIGFIILGILYYLLINKQQFKFNIKALVSYFIALIIISPYLISEIKFNFRTTKALLGFFSKGSKLNLFSIWQKLTNFIDKLIINIHYNLIDFRQNFALILFIILFVLIFFYLINKNKCKKQIIFLLIWFISPAPLYFFEKSNAYFLNIGSSIALLILFAFFAVNISQSINVSFRKWFLLLLMLIIGVSNYYLIINNNYKGEVLLSVQSGLTLSDEIKVLDWIYQKSQGKPFAINTVTNPLYINTTWAYLFDWYGKKKYQYMPAWLGYPQISVFGSQVKFANIKIEKGMQFYLIFEPPAGIPDAFIRAYPTLENRRSKLIEKKTFGRYIVERRAITADKAFSTDDLIFIINNNLYDN